MDQPRRAAVQLVQARQPHTPLAGAELLITGVRLASSTQTVFKLTQRYVVPTGEDIGFGVALRHRHHIGILVYQADHMCKARR